MSGVGVYNMKFAKNQLKVSKNLVLTVDVLKSGMIHRFLPPLRKQRQCRVVWGRSMEAALLAAE